MQLTAPHLVLARLEEIEADLAQRQNALESAAMDFARAKRDHEREYASAFLSADGNVEERRQRARLALKGDMQFAEAQGNYEGLKAVVRVLDTRASIAQSVLKAQSR